MIAHTYAGDAAGTAAPAPSPVRIIPASIPANVAWTASSNVAYALCQWGMLVAFARLGTPEGLGQFAFALAIPAFLLCAALVPDAASACSVCYVGAEESRKAFLLTTVLLSLLPLGMVGTFAWWFWRRVQDAEAVDRALPFGEPSSDRDLTS